MIGRVQPRPPSAHESELRRNRQARERRKRAGLRLPRGWRPRRRIRRGAARGTRTGAWAGAWAGAALVLRLHLLSLWRSRRYRFAVLGWVASTYLLVSLGWAATGGSAGVLLGLASFGTLTVSLCVAPLICATLLSSGRSRGVLPFLQASGLRAGGLAAGAWWTGIAVPVGVLVATLPALLTATILDGAGIALLGQAMLALVAGTAAAAALAVAVAAVVRHRLWTVCLAFVIVALLTVGTLVAYALASSATSETVRLPVRVAAASLAGGEPARGEPAGAEGTSEPDSDGCIVVTQDVTRYRPDRVWGVLALNPYVVLADALAGPADSAARPQVTPVQALSSSIRSVRAAPGDGVVENCPRHAAAPSQQGASTPVWPAGVVALTSAGMAAWWFAARRLRTPADVVGLRRPRRR